MDEEETNELLNEDVSEEVPYMHRLSSKSTDIYESPFFLLGRWKIAIAIGIFGFLIFVVSAWVNMQSSDKYRPLGDSDLVYEDKTTMTTTSAPTVDNTIAKLTVPLQNEVATKVPSRRKPTNQPTNVPLLILWNVTKMNQTRSPDFTKVSNGLPTSKASSFTSSSRLNDTASNSPSLDTSGLELLYDNPDKHNIMIININGSKQSLDLESIVDPPFDELLKENTVANVDFLLNSSMLKHYFTPLNDNASKTASGVPNDIVDHSLKAIDSCIRHMDAMQQFDVGKVQHSSKYETEWSRADCGLGYLLPSPAGNYDTWRVQFVGKWGKNRYMQLLGCPQRCPLSPKCTISVEPTINLTSKPDVVVVLSFDTESSDQALASCINEATCPYTVYHWREAYWHPMDTETQQRMSFEIGVHYSAAIIVSSNLLVDQMMHL
jgi:hypothetical protein